MERYQQAVKEKARDEEDRSRLRSEIRKNIQAMLRNYKEHKVEDMVADHRQSILILSGMKTGPELRL